MINILLFIIVYLVICVITYIISLVVDMCMYEYIDLSDEGKLRLLKENLSCAFAWPISLPVFCIGICLYVLEGIIFRYFTLYEYVCAKLSSKYQDRALRMFNILQLVVKIVKHPEVK